MMGTNRAMLLTPSGAAAIAVIRIVGELVIPLLRSNFSKPVGPMRCVHGDLRDDAGQVIDDAVVVLHEDGVTADLNIHGGPWVVESLLELLRREGFETPQSAIGVVDGGTLMEREVAMDLRLARTEQGVRMLLAQPTAWRKFVASGPTSEMIRFVLDDRCLLHLLRPPRVAIVGAPNVGKSTLANRLFEQDRSITADLPGTTRDWVGEIANLDGLPVMLVDTPGLRETNDPIERSAIARSLDVVERADLIVQVLDATGEFDQRVSAAALIVANKLDRAVHPGWRYDIGAVATTGQGIDELRREIRKRLGCDDLTPNRPRWWTARQRNALASALDGEANLDSLINE
jgi:tRNA modification GTPase